ncbi:MAG: Hgd 2 [Herminiimonas sp.]|nr:Hgd 2 [Herminiimonas sp.]
MQIGILGTGRMGTAIGERLIKCGHVLHVWNRSQGKTAALCALGAVAHGSPAEVVAQCEIIISIVTDSKAIDSAYEGPSGALSAPLRGKLFIEMSTVRPETEIALRAKVVAGGGAIIDCPVGGTVGPAKDGKLLGLVGGDDADVARANPLLAQMCRRVEHVGPSGAGARLKLAINLPLLVFWQAIGEALSLAAPLNLDPKRLMDIMADTSGAPSILKVRGTALADALAGHAGDAAHFNVDSIRKDMRTMREEAQALGRDLPVTTAAMQCFDKAAADGLGDADGTQLAAWWLKQAGKASS